MSLQQGAFVPLPQNLFPSTSRSDPHSPASFPAAMWSKDKEQVTSTPSSPTSSVISAPSSRRKRRPRHRRTSPRLEPSISFEQPVVVSKKDHFCAPFELGKKKSIHSEAIYSSSVDFKDCLPCAPSKHGLTITALPCFVTDIETKLKDSKLSVCESRLTPNKIKLCVSQASEATFCVPQLTHSKTLNDVVSVCATRSVHLEMDTLSERTLIMDNTQTVFSVPESGRDNCFVAEFTLDYGSSVSALNCVMSHPASNSRADSEFCAITSNTLASVCAKTVFDNAKHFRSETKTLPEAYPAAGPVTSAASGPPEVLEPMQPVHPSSVSAGSSGEPSQPYAAASAGCLAEPFQSPVLVGTSDELIEPATDSILLSVPEKCPKHTLCTAQPQPLHPELAVCPEQLQLALSLPEVSATSGSAPPEVSTPAGSAPVSAGGSGEPIQQFLVSTGGSGVSIQP